MFNHLRRRTYFERRTFSGAGGDRDYGRTNGHERIMRTDVKLILTYVVMILFIPNHTHMSIVHHAYDRLVEETKAHVLV